MASKQDELTAQPSESSVAIKVRVQPKASRDRVEGYRGDVLLLRVPAAPEDGKANSAVISLLAQTLGVPKSKVRIVRGHGSRDKVLRVDSITQEEVERSLTALSAPRSRQDGGK